MQNRKGLGLQEGILGVLVFTIIAILILCFIYMFSSLEANFYGSSTPGVAKTAETLTAMNNTGALLSVNGLRGASCTVSVVTNATAGGIIINSANYTVTGCRVKNTTDLVANGFTTWVANYTYVWTADTSASNASSTFITTTAGIIPLAGLVLTVILLALIIGLLVRFGLESGREM